ncbi:DUF4184 family protein [Flavobacterium sp. MAHUQ-51]|uniref:DUF4184 family protein n=1 Tax=Flavobacterium sp. GCM10022190 TaxID=3252639 RepID=UPI00361B1351
MPFTFSHPAIVLPFLKRKYFSATALVVGTMSPDLEYFFRMKIQSEISHTFLGIFLVDLPLALIIAFLFHGIIKKPLIENLPLFFQKRLVVLKNFDWNCYFKNNLLIVFLSFIFGTMTHIFWDSMTHWDGYIVQRVSFFNMQFIGFPIYKIAQHLSSVVGLLVISVYFLRLTEVKLDRLTIDCNYWLAVLLFTIGILIIRFLLWDVSNYNTIGNLIVSVISSVVLATAFAGILFRNQNKI